MEVFLQALVNGILLGGFYSLCLLYTSRCV